MKAQKPYQHVSLAWQPDARKDARFTVLAAILVLGLLALGLIFSKIDVPEKPRTERAKIPERVARFVQEKPKPKPPAPKPKPKPKPPEPTPPEPKVEPVPEDKPKVVRERPKEQKPLTESQKKAREKAQESGLLAHLSELNDLMDTSAVSAQVQGSIKKSDGAQQVAAVNADILTAGAAKGSGGVDAGKYATQAGSSSLSAQELAAAQQALAASNEVFEKQPKSGSDKTETARRETARSTEEVTLAIDRQKGSMQRLYDRARRQNPSLKGKLVLELTIAPDGSVSNARIISSELNDPELERRLLARIKQMTFGAKAVPPVTVKYPIEFLPN